ncbi:MAG: CBS domain-containing protein [Candidatus Hodarchaeales archaeon]
MNRVKVKDLMSKDLVSVECNANIVKVAQLMVEKGIGSVLVYDDNDKSKIGIITQRDLVSRILLECHNPCDIQAKDIATKNLITISEGDTIKDALLMMYKHKIKRIPVKNTTTNELIGIISSYDIVAAFNSLDLPDISRK